MSRVIHFLGICILLSFTLEASQVYSLTDLGAGSALAINSAGTVLAEDASGLPFLFSGGAAQALPQPAGGTFTATALNDFGQVAGHVNYGGAFNYDLAVYSGGKLNVMTNLSGLDPVAINNAGQITGSLVSAYQIFIYSNGVVTQIPAFISGNESIPIGMNAAGEVLGISSSGTGVQQGFTYLNGKLAAVVAPGGVSSSVGGINNMGQVAGEFYQSISTAVGSHVFLYGGGKSTDLGIALNQPSEEDAVFGLNDKAYIVGDAETSLGEFAWIYSPGIGFSNLNNDVKSNAGWQLFQAIGINNKGEIVGNGLLNGVEHGFLLTAVPEPSSLASAGFALTCLAAVLAQRKRRQTR